MIQQEHLEQIGIQSEIQEELCCHKNTKELFISYNIFVLDDQIIEFHASPMFC